MSYFREQLEDWLKQIEVKADRVYDVGGTEKPVESRTKSWEVGEYWILDLNHKEADTRQIEYDINQYPEISAKAEVVFCLEVMEYVWNPVRAIQNLSALLIPGGKLYISFPFVYPMHKPLGIDYLRYTEEGVVKILTECGFKIKELRPRIHRQRGMLAAVYAADGMHSRRDDTVDHTGYLVIAEKQ